MTWDWIESKSNLIMDKMIITQDPNELNKPWMFCPESVDTPSSQHKGVTSSVHSKFHIGYVMSIIALGLLVSLVALG